MTTRDCRKLFLSLDINTIYRAMTDKEEQGQTKSFTLVQYVIPWRELGLKVQINNIYSLHMT